MGSDVLVGRLMWQVVYGRVMCWDVKMARIIRDDYELRHGEAAPAWVGAIAGADLENPQRLAAVQDVAREELALELQALVPLTESGGRRL